MAHRRCTHTRRRHHRPVAPQALHLGRRAGRATTQELRDPIPVCGLHAPTPIATPRDVGLSWPAAPVCQTGAADSRWRDRPAAELCQARESPHRFVATSRTPRKSNHGASATFPLRPAAVSPRCGPPISRRQTTACLATNHQARYVLRPKVRDTPGRCRRCCTGEMRAQPEGTDQAAQ